MKATVNEKRILTLDSDSFKAVIVIKNDTLSIVNIKRKFIPRLYFTKVSAISELKELLDNVYDVLADNNLAGEIIETVR